MIWTMVQKEKLLCPGVRRFSMRIFNCSHSLCRISMSDAYTQSDEFLQEILNRPENEKPYLLIPVGFASDAAMVPSLNRKSLDEIACYY